MSKFTEAVTDRLSSGVLLCSLRDAGWFCAYDSMKNAEVMTDGCTGNIFECINHYDSIRAEKVRKVRVAVLCFGRSSETLSYLTGPRNNEK